MRRKEVKETEGVMKKFDMILNRNILHEQWENVSHGPLTKNALGCDSNTKK